MARSALFPAERIGGLASLQPATLRLAADVRYGSWRDELDPSKAGPFCFSKRNLFALSDLWAIHNAEWHRAVRRGEVPEPGNLPQDGGRCAHCRLVRSRCIAQRAPRSASVSGIYSRSQTYGRSIMPNGIAQFAEAKYLNLETFRKMGVGVRTAVWFARDVLRNAPPVLLQ